jgi:hypothetical protein
MKIGGMAHEMTRFPSIFPSLHGLICGTMVALHLGAKDGYGIKASAREIVEKALDEGGSLVHPDILVTLESLARAEDGDKHTEDAIARSAFLLLDNTRGFERQGLY